MALSKEQILEMRKNLDDQYKKDRETLDRMLDLVNRSRGDSTSSVSFSDEPTLTISDRILGFINDIQGNFTKQQLLKHIADQNPVFYKSLSDQAVSTTLWKLKKEQKIKIVIPKRGIAGAIYTKIKDELL